MEISNVEASMGGTLLPETVNLNRLLVNEGNNLPCPLIECNLLPNGCSTFSKS